MMLVMTLLVRDEAELLAVNLDYHLARGVDLVIVTDHASTDATPEILRAYERQGVVRVLRAAGSGHHQSRRVTRMARLAVVEHGADWVVHTDADEFWWPVSGNLADVLAAVPERYGQIIAPRHDFLPAPDAAGEPFYARMTVRPRRSTNLKGEPLEPKVAHRGHPSVVVAPGNHGISWVGLWPDPAEPPRLEVLHFPLRSPEQFERKVRTVGLAYEALPFRSTEVGRDQLRLLELLRAGRLPEFVAERTLSPAAIRAGLERGDLVQDLRLARFMADTATTMAIGDAGIPSPPANDPVTANPAGGRGTASLSARRLVRRDES